MSSALCEFGKKSSSSETHFIGDLTCRFVADENIGVSDENIGISDENIGVSGENIGVADENIGVATRR